MIAGSIDSKNEEVPLLGERGARDDFDDGFRDFYPSSRANFFEGFFRETGLASGDLQRGFAGNFFHGEPQRVEQSNVGCADGEEYRNAERNTQGSQQQAETMIPPLLQTNVPESQKH